VKEDFHQIETLALFYINSLIKDNSIYFKKPEKFCSTFLLKENFVKSVVLAATEIALYNYNSKDVFFHKIARREFLNLDLFEFWKILNPILNLQINQYSIKCYIVELEILLISFFLSQDSENFKKEFQSFVSSQDFECN
jgi:hypothetical protein